MCESQWRGRRGARGGEAREGVGRGAQVEAALVPGVESFVDVIEGGIAHGKVDGQPASTKSAGIGDWKLTRSPVRGCAKPSCHA